MANQEPGASRLVPNLIGALVMLLAVGALAYALAGRGSPDVTQAADKKPAQQMQAPGQEGGPQHMTLQGQFAGPLKDTIIQRWQDPETGTVCYIYLPVIVQHSPPFPNGMVQYGANGIGSISCLPR
jgi:hypothetical protein